MKVSFEEAKRITAKVLDAASEPQKMTKLELDNIVFDRLGEIPLLEMMVNLNVITKEHITGTVYDKKIFQLVLRIIGGKILMQGQDLTERPDAYAWTTAKVLKTKNRRLLGFHSVEGALTYAEVLATISTARERELFTNLLVNWGRDFTLIHTEKEHRLVIEVTESLATQFPEVPNDYDIEWPAEGATGVELTPIHVGDALILEECSFGTAFYVVQANEFNMTHVKGHIK